MRIDMSLDKFPRGGGGGLVENVTRGLVPLSS